MTVDQIVTIASMIQMEAKYESEYGWISSVFNNRLNNPSYETKGFLQSDATTLYGLEERKGNSYSEDNKLTLRTIRIRERDCPPVLSQTQVSAQ